MVVVAKERSYPPENEPLRSFSGVVDGGWLPRRGHTPPENERHGLFLGGGGWWWLPGSGQPPENERLGSFSGVVGAGGRLTSILELK